MKLATYGASVALLISAGTLGLQAQSNSITGGFENNAPQNNNTQRGQLTERDFKFVMAATEGGKTEVVLGQLAAKNAADPSVKDFGAQMVRDHQAANDQLAQVVSLKGATVSDTPSARENRTINRLQNLNGAEFDRAYIKDMVADHKKDVKEFQKEANDGDDAEVKAFASKTLPTLQEHLRMAQDLETRLNSTASR